MIKVIDKISFIYKKKLLGRLLRGHKERRGEHQEQPALESVESEQLTQRLAQRVHNKRAERATAKRHDHSARTHHARHHKHDQHVHVRECQYNPDTTTIGDIDVTAAITNE
jgi:hypothetical protein